MANSVGPSPAHIHHLLTYEAIPPAYGAAAQLQQAQGGSAVPMAVSPGQPQPAAPGQAQPSQAAQDSVAAAMHQPLLPTAAMPPQSFQQLLQSPPPLSGQLPPDDNALQQKLLVALNPRRGKQKMAEDLIGIEAKAIQQLPPGAQLLYLAYLKNAKETGQIPDLGALDHQMAVVNGNRPPAGPLTVWYLNVMMSMIGQVGQRQAAVPRRHSTAMLMESPAVAASALPVVASSQLAQSANNQKQSS